MSNLKKRAAAAIVALADGIAVSALRPHRRQQETSASTSAPARRTTASEPTTTRGRR